MSTSLGPVRRRFLTAFLVVVPVICGCSPLKAQTPPLDPPRVALVLDQSGTAVKFGLPLPEVADIRPLTNVLAQRGGQLQTFFVRESGRSVGPGVAFKPAPPPPRLPALTGGPFSITDAATRTDYQTQLQQYQESEKKRVTESMRLLDVFLTRFDAERSLGRKSQTSAVREALLFAIRFLNAPPLLGTGRGMRLLVVSSDCIDDAPTSPKFNLPTAGQVLVMWVNPNPADTQFPVPGTQPELFATPAQALQYAVTMLESSTPRSTKSNPEPVI